VATVNYLEECDLRVTREVNVLRTISDELHKATSCHCIYLLRRKNLVK
jgi:hypothetical protein